MLACHNPPLVHALQGPRYSMPYFVNPKLNYSIQGPQKRWGPVTGFDLLSKTGACMCRCGASAGVSVREGRSTHQFCLPEGVHELLDRG